VTPSFSTLRPLLAAVAALWLAACSVTQAGLESPTRSDVRRSATGFASYSDGRHTWRKAFFQAHPSRQSSVSEWTDAATLQIGLWNVIVTIDDPKWSATAQAAAKTDRESLTIRIRLSTDQQPEVWSELLPDYASATAPTEFAVGRATFGRPLDDSEVADAISTAMHEAVHFVNWVSDDFGHKGLEESVAHALGYAFSVVLAQRSCSWITAEIELLDRETATLRDVPVQLAFDSPHQIANSPAFRNGADSLVGRHSFLASLKRTEEAKLQASAGSCDAKAWVLGAASSWISAAHIAAQKRRSSVK
jgi:hypothetical protein